MAMLMGKGVILSKSRIRPLISVKLTINPPQADVKPKNHTITLSHYKPFHNLKFGYVFSGNSGFCCNKRISGFPRARE
jgi:hypothetical protein